MQDTSIFPLLRAQEDHLPLINTIFAIYEGNDIKYKAPRELSAIDSFLASSFKGTLSQFKDKSDDIRRRDFARILYKLSQLSTWKSKAIHRADIGFQALLIFLAKGQPSTFNISLISEATGLHPKTLKAYIEILVEMGLAYRQKAFLLPNYPMIKSDAYSFADTGLMLFMLGVSAREDVYWKMGLGDTTLLNRVIYGWVLDKLEASVGKAIGVTAGKVIDSFDLDVKEEVELQGETDAAKQESLFSELELDELSTPKEASNQKDLLEHPRAKDFDIEYMLTRDNKRIDFMLTCPMSKEEKEKHFVRLTNDREVEIKKLPRGLRKALEEEGNLRPEITFEPKLYFPINVTTYPVIREDNPKLIDLKWILDNEKRAPFGIILFPGREARKLAKNIWAIPLAHLIDASDFSTFKPEVKGKKRK